MIHSASKRLKHVKAILYFISTVLLFFFLYILAEGQCVRLAVFNTHVVISPRDFFLGEVIQA